MNENDSRKGNRPPPAPVEQAGSGKLEADRRRHDNRPAPMRILKAGIWYFALVFGVGFVLGFIRVLWTAPRFGTRAAELLEMPFMLVAIIFAAQWVVRRLAVPAAGIARLSVGLIGLGLLLCAEFVLVLRLRGLSVEEYLASRDPVAGAVYYMMLGVFAVMPLLVARNGRRATTDKNPITRPQSHEP